MDTRPQTALLAAALASCPQVPAEPPCPETEDPCEDPPAYDSAPGLRRTPRVDRLHPPHLGDLVRVTWPDGASVQLSLGKALARSAALRRPATLSAAGLPGKIEPSADSRLGISWSIWRTA